MAARPSLSLARLPLFGKIIFGVVIVSLVAAGYYVVLHTEVSARIDNARRATNDLDAQLSQQHQAQASYMADRDELAMREQKQRELDKVLPTDTEAASFLSSIQSVSNISGVDLKAWQPVEEKNEAYFAKVPMKLELTGKFHQIAKFMYEVGRQDRIINMENIELSDPKVQGDDVILKTRCLATTFHLVKQAPPKAAVPGQPGAPGAAPGAPATSAGGTR